MYGIDGRHALTEEILDHLEGYKGSRPVRIGNGAYNQLQLDIYGELMDSVYLYNKYGSPISYELWVYLRRLINWVCDNWQRKDEGVWEVRGGQQHFVYSKLMCWVAIDRGIRLADKRSFPADRERWLTVRDQIYEDIMAKGWSQNRHAFVQHYGSETLDAANLMLPLVFFLSPTDPRMLQTLDAVNQPPEQGGLVSNSLVYRYNVEHTADGLAGEEGTFNICTFWLVEALTRAGRDNRARLDEARLMFEQMLGYANHLGLYAEETGNRGEALGNFPQAFTHLALISAAFNLDRTLGTRG
jgi:GH15 family glucan-1,4-alpha-glucosidase